jgi:hypothetical protein
METINKIEQELTQSAELAIREAQAITISSSAQYVSASQLLIEHKNRIKAVTEYWSKPKIAAKAAHQEICDKEKAMLAPFSNAESIIKAAMVAYQRKVDDERRAAEQEAYNKRQKETERLMAEALKAEAAGKTKKAEAVLDKATAVEQAPIVVEVAGPKASGISTRKEWKARVVDEKLVPAYAYQVVIRPINQAALNLIAKTSKGTDVIPGVEFYEDMIINARI